LIFKDDVSGVGCQTEISGSVNEDGILSVDGHEDEGLRGKGCLRGNNPLN
jgi:hypothetical protein